MSIRPIYLSNLLPGFQPLYLPPRLLGPGPNSSRPGDSFICSFNMCHQVSLCYDDTTSSYMRRTHGPSGLSASGVARSYPSTHRHLHPSSWTRQPCRSPTDQHAPRPASRARFALSNEVSLLLGRPCLVKEEVFNHALASSVVDPLPLPSLCHRFLYVRPLGGLCLLASSSSLVPYEGVPVLEA